jgi:hypothetical protein
MVIKPTEASNGELMNTRAQTIIMLDRAIAHRRSVIDLEAEHADTRLALVRVDHFKSPIFDLQIFREQFTRRGGIARIRS